MLLQEMTDQTAARRAHGLEPAAMPTRPHTATLRREGDFWTVVFDGRICRLKDSKGLRYLERLLSHPGSEFHVLDLVRSQCAASCQSDESIRGMRGAAHAGDAILDARAKEAYRRRVRELSEELNEAEQFNDIGRTGRIRAELEALTEQLAGAVGLGGRDRTAACASERARSTVTQRLKDTIRKIGMNAPVLGDYLQRAVRTGTFCAYLPGIAQVIRWNLE